MPRATYVLRDGALVERHLAAPLRTPARSGLPRPYVINDGCEFVSQADGQVYTSKSRYRSDLKARGLVEVGNDSSWQSAPAAPDPVGLLPPVEQDIKQAIAELSSK